MYQSAQQGVHRRRVDRAPRRERTADSIDEDDEDCHDVMGRILLIKGDTNNASFHIKKALELNICNPMNWLTKSFILIKKGKHDDALDALTVAASLDPKKLLKKYLKDEIFNVLKKNPRFQKIIT